MRKSIFILAMCMLLLDCNKHVTVPGTRVDIYMLASYELAQGKCSVNPSYAILQPAPLIADEDILEYSPSTYEFKLADTSFRKLSAIEPRTPFAITVDKKVVYYAIHMPLYMNSTCENSITFHTGPDSKVQLGMGYPGLTETSSIDDQRNNPKIVATLAAEGKLR